MSDRTRMLFENNGHFGLRQELLGDCTGLSVGHSTHVSRSRLSLKTQLVMRNVHFSANALGPLTIFKDDLGEQKSTTHYLSGSIQNN